jgi:hypothetical protein
MTGFDPKRQFGKQFSMTGVDPPDVQDLRRAISRKERTSMVQVGHFDPRRNRPEIIAK